jgi:ABC-type polysaccharide/polyol phosphate transport system ATPase subunit
VNRLAVRAEGLGKQYRVGRVRRKADARGTLSEVVMDTIRAPVANLRALRGLGRVDAAGQAVAWALRDVSFDLHEGEVLGIVGRNGAGKSTLLKILSRITQPTCGRAEVYGRIGSLLEIGTGFHPDLTGRQNVYLNGAILGMDRRHIARHFDEIVEFAGIGSYIDTPVKRYSSGMQVRLAFAVAAHLEPDVMIVDEVLAVGDAEFQRKCLAKMDAAASGGRTVLFVSHNMKAVEQLCTRCLLIHDGRIAAEGSADEIIRRYLADAAARTPSAVPNRWIALDAADRKGTGDARFDALRYSAGPRRSTGAAQPDAPVDFTLRIRSDVERRIPGLAVTLYDEHGTLLLNADAAAFGRTIRLAAGTTLVSITIEALHLRPGTYTVGLWLAEAAHVIYDHVPAAVRLTVQDAVRREELDLPGVVTCDFQIVEADEEVCA